VKAVLDAVYSRFSHSSMDLFLKQAPPGQALPYCVYAMAGHRQHPVFGGGVTEDVDLEFVVFADTDTEAMALGEDLHTLYDDAVLAALGYVCLGMDRDECELDRDEEGVWQHVTIYNVMMDKE
jgi:hypothetical protein